MSTKIAFAYLRISRDPEDERRGVTGQRLDVKRLAASLGSDLRTIFEDNDVSAFTKRKAATAWGAAGLDRHLYRRHTIMRTIIPQAAPRATRVGAS